MYFKYLSKNYTILKILKNVKFFKKIYDIPFYSKIINLIESVYIDKLKSKNNKISIIKNYNSIGKIYAIKPKISKNYMRNFLIYYIIFTGLGASYDKTILLEFKKALYIYKPSKLVKRVFIRNYFYYRSRKYEKKPVKYNFRLFYLKNYQLVEYRKLSLSL